MAFLVWIYTRLILNKIKFIYINYSFDKLLNLTLYNLNFIIDNYFGLNTKSKAGGSVYNQIYFIINPKQKTDLTNGSEFYVNASSRGGEAIYGRYAAGLEIASDRSREDERTYLDQDLS